MTAGIVHVYDLTTHELLALGTASEPHPRRVIELPDEISAEVALYQELAHHEGQQRYASPRWN